MSDSLGKRTKLRYRWSHRHPLHRALVRGANRLLPRVPFAVKYGATGRLRKGKLPYRLVGPGSTAIQVGAPRDTLLAGRSRAMDFVRRTHPGGRVLVVEPDPASVDEFRRMAEQQGMRHVEVIHAAAWNERTTVTIEIDPQHPATSFTAGATEYRPEEMSRFRELEVDAVAVDELVEQVGLDRVDLVSITTNGAEREILCGLERTIQRDRPYIGLARTEDSYAEIMSDLGYELLGHDDRGFTFRPRR